MTDNSLPKLTSIVILIPYFGQWPFWINIFIASCKANPTIHWRIYTDCGGVSDCPDNVQLIAMSFAEYCQLTANKLGITFHPENAYKLCDIKPALGLIHEEDIQNYDFWAFGDIDMVYGNLRSYFTEERLARKDLIATHARRISGHLCLLRNTDDMRHAFKKVTNWQALLMKSNHVAFDEKPFSKVFLRHKNSPVWVRWVAALLDPWLKRAEFNEAYTTPNAKIAWEHGRFPTVWYWQAGRVTNDLSGSKEYPYFHFMVWKKNWPKLPFILMPSNDNARWRITELGFELLE
jgi:hypothetical protein